eukprot:4697960-Heterocapsa_arctica.AAC.1
MASQKKVDVIEDYEVKIRKSIDEMELFEKGDFLVADMTDPTWEPIMKLASGIVTNTDGRTRHAAIIARELGILASPGCLPAAPSGLT